jgi:DNA-binding CsgD family transcriptional regulator
MVRYKFLIFLLIGFISQNLRSQSGISGHIIIDTTIWKPEVYMSIISNFSDMYSMSNEIIVEKANIDPSGKFTFNIQYLPDNDNLYRLHFSKKTDPPASLIIGGKDENHFFLIANNHSTVQIIDTIDSEFIKGISIKGYYPNQILQQVDAIATYLDSTKFNGSIIKISLIRSSVFEKLRQVADTCSNPLVSLYALYKSKFEQNYPTNQQYYKNFLSKWRKEQSSYFVEFRKEIPSSGNKKILSYLIMCCTVFVLGYLTSLRVTKLKRNPNPIADLSLQQRKIFALLIEGKSNKEISELLSIELSTVKTHINRIYSKLGLNSRKDIANLNMDQK